jgi:predicted lipase
MSDWTRRRVLLAGLGVGCVASGLAESLRRRRMLNQERRLSEQFLNTPQAVDRAVTDAIEGDLESTAEVERILADLRLPAPTVPYDREASKTLILASRLATEQYLTGKFDLRFDGSIRGLPSYDERYGAYTQVASIRGPEMVNAEKRIAPDGAALRDPLLAGADLVRERIQGLAGRGMVLRWSYPVYWGFVLTGPRHHILVLRGTQRGYEWLQTINARQVVSSEMPEFTFPGAIHQGFARIYARLSKPVIEAARRLDPAKPLLLSGHSLGSPLATLAAIDIAERIPAFAPNLRLFTYAGPRLGDPAFAEAFSQRIPNSYRVVNLADLVPQLPPTKAKQIVYVHLGQPWAFTTSVGDIGPNHFISAYREAVDAEAERPLDEVKSPAA